MTAHMTSESVQIVGLKNRIESFEKIHQIEVLKFFVENKVVVNENSSGSLINLGFLKETRPAVYADLEKLVAFIEQQNTILDQIEAEKKNISLQYFQDADGSFIR